MKTYKGIVGPKLKENEIYVYDDRTGTKVNAIKYFGCSPTNIKGLSGSSYGLNGKNLKELFQEAINNPKNLYYIPYGDVTKFGDTEYSFGKTPQEVADKFSLLAPIPTNLIFEESFAKLIHKQTLF